MNLKIVQKEEIILGQDSSEITPDSPVYYAGTSIVCGNYMAVVSSGWSEAVTFTIPEPGEATTLPPTNTSPINPPTLTNDISTSDSFNPSPPPQHFPWATYLLTIIITTCIITIPMTIVMYYNKRQQRKTNTLRLHKS